MPNIFSDDAADNRPELERKVEERKALERQKKLGRWHSSRLFVIGIVVFASGFLGLLATIFAGIAAGPWEYWTNDTVISGWYAALLGTNAVGTFWFFAVVAVVGFVAMIRLARKPKNGE
ncbi:MAG: hypothetical protein LBO63_07575 [Oscillospiraceae bacterium]|jgi:sterol desaturase/sphingolipid hydroxylase (fatty acid hydroxylase superfamily)|nr:hypothetical protein [Oscillospiraceae bacterium]